MDAEVADGFAVHVHNDVERAGEAILFSVLFPGGAEEHILNFSRHVLPQPDILLRGHIQGLCMFVRISGCLVIPAFSSAHELK